MIAQLLTAHPLTGAIRPLTPGLLREAFLLPRPRAFDLMPVLAAQTDAPWAESFALAPAETAAVVCAELTGLILATPDMQPEAIDLSRLTESRAARHLKALIDLWRALDDALPEGLETIRRTIAGEGIALESLPLLDVPLPANAPAAVHALRNALVARFGLAPDVVLQAWRAEQARLTDGAPPECSLGQIQRHLTDGVGPAAQDDSLTVWGIRDLVDEAEACAAMVQTLVAQGARPQNIALLIPEDTACHRHLARAFARVGVPLSGLPQASPERDLPGEALTHLLAALQTPAPAMAMASLYALPGMPWPAQTGAALAREALEGRAQPRWAAEAGGPLAEITGLIARPRPTQNDELRRRLDRFAALLPDSALRQGLQARLNLLRTYLHGQSAPDWALLTSMAAPRPQDPPEPRRCVEGVSILRETDEPWRPCRILMVLGVRDGRYPRPPANSAMFMDSEREIIAQTTGLRLQGRAERLAEGLALFRRQIALPSQRLVLFCPRQALDGSGQMPGPALALIARCIADPATPGQAVTEPEHLIRDLRRDPAARGLCQLEAAAPAMSRPGLPAEGLVQLGTDLLRLRQTENGLATPQSPSRLETLLVSPLAWLLDQAGAEPVEWLPQEWDIMTAGTLAHDVLEHLFRPGELLPSDAEIAERTPAIITEAIRRKAPFAQGALWVVERDSLTGEAILAACNWAAALRAMQAEVVANEVGLRGEWHGIGLRGFADSVLRLPGGDLLIVDHKKSRTGQRHDRMQAGWDLQTELYRAMLRNPAPPHPDAPPNPFAGANGRIGVAYHLLNDSGILCHGVEISAEAVTRIDTDISVNALAMLKERLADVGAGRIRLNSDEDADFFSKTCKFTPYALAASPLIAAFTIGATDAVDEDEE